MTWYWPDWPTQPPPVLPRARCQHCERDIEQLASGTWADGDGITVCKKRVGDEPLLLHTPMPAAVGQGG